MIFQFACRAHCHLKETGKLHVAISAATLCNICRDGNAGSSDLARESVQLISRECRGGLIDRHSQVMGLFPYFDTSEISHVELSAIRMSLMADCLPLNARFHSGTRS